MVAAIDKTTGKAAFVFVESRGWPWHREGIPVQNLMSADDVLEACPAVAFDVMLRPLYFFDLDGNKTRVPGWSTTVRLDTNASLGIVSDGYPVFPFKNVLALGETLTGLGAGFETVGSLMDGRLLFASMELDSDGEFYIEGDPSPHQRRLLLSTGHDGRHAFTAKRVAGRTVCFNTWLEAMSEGGSQLTVRHTSGMDVRVEEARRIIGLSERADQKYVSVMRELTRKHFDPSDIAPFTEALLPTPDDDKKHTRVQAKRDLLADLIAKSDTLDGVKPSAYRTFQAVIEFADWGRRYSSKGLTPEQAQAVSVLDDGSAQTMKQKALILLQS